MNYSLKNYTNTYKISQLKEILLEVLEERKSEISSQECDLIKQINKIPLYANNIIN